MTDYVIDTVRFHELLRSKNFWTTPWLISTKEATKDDLKSFLSHSKICLGHYSIKDINQSLGLSLENDVTIGQITLFHESELLLVLVCPIELIKMKLIDSREITDRMDKVQKYLHRGYPA